MAKMIGKVFRLGNKFKTIEGRTERLKILNWMSGFTPSAPGRRWFWAVSTAARTRWRCCWRAAATWRRWTTSAMTRITTLAMARTRRWLPWSRVTWKKPIEVCAAAAASAFLQKIENPGNQLHLQLNRIDHKDWKVLCCQDTHYLVLSVYKMIVSFIFFQGLYFVERWF